MGKVFRFFSNTDLKLVHYTIIQELDAKMRNKFSLVEREVVGEIVGQKLKRVIYPTFIF